MITPSQRQSVLQSLPEVLTHAQEVSKTFHERLFELRPNLRSLFASEANEQERNLVQFLNGVSMCLEAESSSETNEAAKSEPEATPDSGQWQREVDPEHDLSMMLWAMNRRDEPLYRVPDQAHQPVGEAFLHALQGESSEEEGGKLNVEQRGAWAAVFAAMSKLQQVAAASKVHPAPKNPKKPEFLLSGEFDELELPALLKALSLCHQYLKVTLQDEVERPSGELLLKSGQVLAADCQDEGGQPAFRLLLMRPHHRFRVERIAKPSPMPSAFGTVLGLLETFGPATEMQDDLVNPAHLAANGEAVSLNDRVGDAEDEDEPDSGTPTPVMTPIPLMPLRPLDSTQASAGEESDAPAPSKTPAWPLLSLTRIVLPWVPKLAEIPHLRGLIMLEEPTELEGKFWSQDGAQISVAALGSFAQATIAAHRNLPTLSSSSSAVGYRSTTEHRLGCVVVDVDANGKVRVCLFDPATPLGKVRHTVEAIITMSQPKNPSAKR